MKRWPIVLGGVAAGLVLSAAYAVAEDYSGHPDPATLPIGDERVLPYHLQEADIEAGKIPLDQLRSFGQLMYVGRFTRLDGEGRPAATSATIPTHRPKGETPSMFRTSGPDSEACTGCHTLPAVGGAGDFATNAFMSSQENDFDYDTIEPELSMERGPPSEFGVGLLELLGREMTVDLQREERHGMAQARASGQPVRIELTTKGESFGAITAHPDGFIDNKELQGVDPDLIVKPFGQKAVFDSIRHFTVTALNNHFGMEAVERFGPRWTNETDFAGNGVGETITEGDVTALVLFQALLPAPVQVLPTDDVHKAAAEKGEALFKQIGCESCHRMAMVIDNPVFTEPSPNNLAGALRPQDTVNPYAVDFRKLPWSKRLNITGDGKIIVRAFTDLKRHQIADAERPHFANEKLTQGFVPINEFRTAPMWGIGSTSPFGHRRDLTTMNDAIVDHGGEGTASRKAYEALSDADQRCIIEFLKAQKVEKDDTWPDPPPPDEAKHAEAQ